MTGDMQRSARKARHPSETPAGKTNGQDQRARPTQQRGEPYFLLPEQAPGLFSEILPGPFPQPIPEFTGAILLDLFRIYLGDIPRLFPGFTKAIP